jgi:polysaccharide export outer membrane protein
MVLFWGFVGQIALIMGGIQSRELLFIGKNGRTRTVEEPVMKNWIHRAFIACLLSSVAFSIGARGQVAPSNPADGGPAADDTTLAPPHVDASYVIGNDDVLSINVWKEAELSRQLPVRSDGKISLPLIGDVQAAGRTPLQLQRDIVDKLKSFITDPQVAVIVQQINSLKFNVLGQVNKPGSYPLTAGTTIVDAIAVAGGFRDFAKKKSIYVIRPEANGSEHRFIFNYQSFVKGANPDQNIALKPRDTVVVP